MFLWTFTAALEAIGPRPRHWPRPFFFFATFFATAKHVMAAARVLVKRALLEKPGIKRFDSTDAIGAAAQPVVDVGAAGAVGGVASAGSLVLRVGESDVDLATSPHSTTTTRRGVVVTLVWR